MVTYLVTNPEDGAGNAAGADAAPEGALDPGKARARPAKRPPSTRGRGRPTTHGATALRRTLSALTTKRLDGRSAVAVAVRTWTADIRRDLGGDLTRAQETVLEGAAQSWVILRALDDYIARQPTLVTKKRRVADVVLQRMQIAAHLERSLGLLGLSRKAAEVDVSALLASFHGDTAPVPSPPSAPAEAAETPRKDEGGETPRQP